MKIKVCGLKEPENIKEVLKVNPDYIGFIFFSPSPRNALGLSYKVTNTLPKDVKKVGVFVDTNKDVIEEYAGIHHLQAVQLHGEHSPELCRRLRNTGLEVIKAVSIPENADENFFKSLEDYKDYVDLFLFDSAGKYAGGNGIKFNWDILKHYHLDIPYILSGGIGPDDVNLLKKGLPSKCIGIDLNSKFEKEPGVKDIEKLKNFIMELRNESVK